MCLLDNKILGVHKSKGHLAQQLLLKTRKIYRHCGSSNHAGVGTAEVENSWETSVYILGFLLVNRDPIRQCYLAMKINNCLFSFC